MAVAASPLDVPLHPDLGILAQRVEGFFAKLTRQRLKRGVFRSVIDLQVAINRFVAETNLNPKPFVWTADPKRVIAAVKRGSKLRVSPLRLTHADLPRHAATDLISAAVAQQ